MVITEADLWMLPNPLQVQIKSITAKPCFLHRGIVFSNLFPVCLQMHICTSLYNQSLKKKIKIEVYHRNGTACEGEKKNVTSFKFKFDFPFMITRSLWLPAYWNLGRKLTASEPPAEKEK